MALCPSPQASKQPEREREALSAAPTVRVNVAVLIGPMAATVIVAATKRRTRSGRCRAHYAAHNRADRAAHSSPGHDAPRGPDSLRWRGAGAQSEASERDPCNIVHSVDLPQVPSTTDDAAMRAFVPSKERLSDSRFPLVSRECDRGDASRDKGRLGECRAGDEGDAGDQ
jgi:hypothetical protein